VPSLLGPSRCLTMSDGPSQHPLAVAAAKDLPFPTTELFADLIEQLMRSTDDDTLLLDLFEVSTSASSLASLLGKLLPGLSVPLLPGTPVLALLGYGPLDPSWRDHVPALPVSLWSELCLLRELSRTTPAPDPLTELLNARI
jgi:hypothetical protein